MDMSMKDMFSPKRIIFDGVKKRIEGTGIVKLILYFNIKTDKYNVMLQKEDNSSMKLEIEQDDITLIKKVLTNKVQKKAEQVLKKEIKAIIVQMDLKTDTLDIITEDMRGIVELFDYKL